MNGSTDPHRFPSPGSFPPLQHRLELLVARLFFSERYHGRLCWNKMIENSLSGLGKMLWPSFRVESLRTPHPCLPCTFHACKLKCQSVRCLSLQNGFLPSEAAVCAQRRPSSGQAGRILLDMARMCGTLAGHLGLVTGCVLLDGHYEASTGYRAPTSAAGVSVSASHAEPIHTCPGPMFLKVKHYFCYRIYINIVWLAQPVR